MLNGITLELLWRRLISMVDEAAASLVRTSFSSIVRESNDFACVITDAKGNSIAQASNSIPSFIGTAPRTIRAFLEAFPEETLSEGDILMTNDVWLGTGHLPDITVGKPIFLEGKLVAWAGSVAHAPDIGGRVRSADATSVFEEGLQIPIMKVLRAGEMDPTLERILRQNVRVPDQVMGDLYAQFTGLALIERQTAELLREYNLNTLEGLSEELRSRSEAAMRKAITAVPDGTYHAEAISDGIDAPIRLKMALTVKGDEIAIDFAGTDPQVQKSINVCLAYTTAYTSYGVKAVLCPDVPNNDGALAPLTVTAPAGSILNSLPPAAGGARALIGHFLPAMVMNALAQAVPDKVIAGVGSPLWCVNMAGTHPDGRSFANLFFLNGGYGASARSDGVNVLSWPSNISSTPVEIIEQVAPLLVHRRSFRDVGDANGMHRGGTGQELLLESLSENPATISFMAERTKEESATPGMNGGEPGMPGEIQIDGVKVNPKAQQIIKRGAKVLLRTPGGGGYGDAKTRPAELIEQDRVRGYAK
ncbi:hydantoinase B/oxoprolinase family protein [Cupriavidus taiwanensis]|uniref:Hydantoin utilization protein B n=1 Tax=Cupriavidus taiwanensis TaxID=164546 RepID=A0A7Z7NPU0_9BURK|nr:hydantoinase B/oxoprolinase family protein [Cupriavidus taiwanensis]SOZ17195.1 Hydantoin utilization protein B [Cupriavidus taiwanensis]SOZ96479.1 Hydantoin utilization protein B [Cupriavidus taiwanensis]SPC25578.1 Hydantoin utilization protein B [Cupriavidus taiwanensis]